MANDMRRDRRVALSVTDMSDPYRRAAVQGRVVEVPPDEGCRYMDPISVKHTGEPFPSRGPDRVCLVIAVEQAAQRTLGCAQASCCLVRRSNRCGSPQACAGLDR